MALSLSASTGGERSRRLESEDGRMRIRTIGRREITKSSGRLRSEDGGVRTRTTERKRKNGWSLTWF